MAGLSKKLQQLDEFLLKEAGEDAMLLSELDGFLAGLIVCPETVMPSEWMPVVWGGEGPGFDDVEQAQAVSSLILGHYNDIIRQLDQGRYRPIYDIDTDDSILWETWIGGFVEAIRLRPEAWLAWAQVDADADLQRAWFVLSRLGEMSTSTRDIEPLDIDEQLEDLAPDLIPSHVEILHQARLAQAKPPLHSANENRPKVGRNDPCPCGSGKKFKKCCLH